MKREIERGILIPCTTTNRTKPDDTFIYFFIFLGSAKIRHLNPRKRVWAWIFRAKCKKLNYLRSWANNTIQNSDTFHISNDVFAHLLTLTQKGCEQYDRRSSKFRRSNETSINSLDNYHLHEDTSAISNAYLGGLKTSSKLSQVVVGLIVKSNSYTTNWKYIADRYLCSIRYRTKTQRRRSDGRSYNLLSLCIFFVFFTCLYCFFYYVWRDFCMKTHGEGHA